MSSIILEKLKQKPIPQKSEQKPIAISHQAVEVKTKIVDKTSTDYDRESFIQRLKEKQLVKPKIDIKAKQIIDVLKTKPDTPEKLDKPIKIKTKKLGRIKLKSKITKGTITDIQKESSLPTKIPISSFKIGDEIVSERLKKKDDISIITSEYYMNNREHFINFINSLFQPYREQLTEEEEREEKEISCEKKVGDFSLFAHQKIIKDYMNLYTPYRGLLLYHGLGSGKTCASIAVAEGIKNTNQIFIMTPASLRPNYIEELKNCGDELYKKNQFWEFILTKDNPEYIKILSKVLSIPKKFIKNKGGAWMVNTTKPSNYYELTTEEKNSLEIQLNTMISSKYRFINYNGLRKSHLDIFTEGGKKNLFDNSVVIIDEAHNFISRIVNKLNKKDSLSMNLYELLLDAQNCRIIFLTGTPVINYPNEIAVLFNILRGYIKTFQIPLDIHTQRKIDEKEIKKILNKLKLLDFIEYKPSSKMLIITRNPIGFISEFKENNYEGVNINSRGNIDDESLIKIITSELGKENIKILPQGIRVEKYKALPDKLDQFTNMFIKAEKGDLINTNLLKRRIIGLTSYYRSAEEQLMPRFDKNKNYHVIKIPMSDYQFGIYEGARVQERKLEKQSKKKKKNVEGVYEDSISTYRIFSRAFCNFVFPRTIQRPMPNEEGDIQTALNSKIDEDMLDNASLEERLENVDGRFLPDESEKISKELSAKSDLTYEKRIHEALKLLKENSKEYLTPEGLITYSPKFLNVLNNIENPKNNGLHLIYSQFRTLEGIGILKFVLEANGYAHFKIKKENEKWNIDISEADKGKPTFALYTGTETVEEKEILRNIFNGTWENVPTDIVDKLKIISTNNNYGEIIKVLMITAAGAEGITLKNVRFVHLIEPYWHPVRLEQVIGRARRICSHHALLEAERTVDVFLYLMKFSDEQLKSDVSIELRLKDKSKIDKTMPLTSDEALYEISNIKEDINKQLLTAVKETAIDCAIHTRSTSKEQLVCLSFAGQNPNKFSFKPSISTEEKDIVSNINTKKISWKAREIKLDGKRYAYRKETQQVYDYDSYIMAMKNSQVNPILIGKIIKNEQGKLVLKKMA